MNTFNFTKEYFLEVKHSEKGIEEVQIQRYDEKTKQKQWYFPI